MNSERMSPEHEAHLARIVAGVSTDIAAKYRKGQEEHGGQLWRKPNLLTEARNEALDQLTYLDAVQLQYDEARRLLARAIIDRDWNLAAQAFNVLATGNPEGEAV